MKSPPDMDSRWPRTWSTRWAGRSGARAGPGTARDSRFGCRSTAKRISLVGPRSNTGPPRRMKPYPPRGQSFDQQAVDKAECQRWATEQTGYNPATPPPPPMAGPPQGGMFRGAAGGAALGAVGGAIGGDAGKGAAIGAGVGALFGGFRRMRAMEEEQAQMANYQAQTAQATGGFNRAYGACL